MDKRRWSIPLAIFILLCDVASPYVISAANFPLTQIKVNTPAPDSFFKKIYNSIYVGLSIYKSDAVQQHSKERIIENFKKLCDFSGVSFDLENIDIIKKGWTRYYPFSVDGRSFIMRIFLTEEKYFQPVAPVLYEGSIVNPEVTFQILPSLNDILSDCKIKPTRTYSTRQVDTSA